MSIGNKNIGGIKYSMIKYMEVNDYMVVFSTYYDSHADIYCYRAY